MDKPVININGTIYEIIEIKSRLWRIIAEFEENKNNLSNADFIDKHAELLALFFDGISVDDILDNVDLSDILKIYFDCYQYIYWLMYSKLKILDSTQDVGVVTEV